MDVLKQLARSTGYSVCVNHKVSMMAATINKQGDVELLNFELDGSNNFVIDVSICCDHIGNSTGNNGHLKCKMQSNDYLQERAGVTIRKYSADYAVVGTAFVPAIVSVAGQIHPCRSWLTNRRASTMRSSARRRRLTARLSCGDELARLVLTRTLLAWPFLLPLPYAYASVHTTALPARHQADQPMSIAECLMHGDAHASHRTPPHPAPPRPAVNVGVGAFSTGPSAHATIASTSREANMVADGTHATGDVAAAEWLAATFGGGDVNAGGTGACASAVDDGLCPGFEGRATSASPSSYLLIVHNNDVDVTPLLSLQNAAPGGSGDGEDCDGVDDGVAHPCLHDHVQSDDDDNDSPDILEAILGHVGQREDAGYDDDGADVSVGLCSCMCWWQWSRCQCRCRSRYQSSCSSPPPYFQRLAVRQRLFHQFLDKFPAICWPKRWRHSLRSIHSAPRLGLGCA